ncbi:hypothetical protein AOQ84DRAFT_375168 [Glonium stellatum]|uniref:Uncharacterized protein n=1 Tax=Glonium stellatum TaxID=574774 RepID=A0A8E2JUN9_9PEZI|nr:hypothetical protein AOQ84DRAFT_375168 [Glonium stellatum]
MALLATQSSGLSDKPLFVPAEGRKIGWKKLEADGVTASGYYSGVTILNGKKTDGSYVATFEQNEDSLPLPTSGNSTTRKEIGVNVAGVLDVIGYLITDTKELGVQLNVLGITAGNFYGNAETGVVIEVDLLLITGTVNFYIKAGALQGQKELRVKYSLTSAIFASTLAEGDEKIPSF